MRTSTISILAAAALATITKAWSDSAVHETVLPTASPALTVTDPWQCVTENLTQYFDVPKPTGSLLTAIESYADKLIESCTLTGADAIHGCFPEKEAWCDFSTAAPSTVLPDYSAYGSAASAWWAAHRANAVELAVDCPVGWYNAMLSTPGVAPAATP